MDYKGLDWIAGASIPWGGGDEADIFIITILGGKKNVLYNIAYIETLVTENVIEIERSFSKLLNKGHKKLLGIKTHSFSCSEIGGCFMGSEEMDTPAELYEFLV